MGGLMVCVFPVIVLDTADGDVDKKVGLVGVR